MGQLVPTGNGGLIPSIDTTQLETQVLVGNGETVVLGGVFKTEDVESSAAKFHFLATSPTLVLFLGVKRKFTRKQETLIFITPRILADTLLD